MKKKKICLLGSFAVGKTSLFEKYLYSMFSEKYLTTVGVKIDKKVLALEGEELTLIIWDLEGRSEFSRMRSTYLRGMDGYFLIVDGTRAGTVEDALEMNESLRREFPSVPFVIVENKADMVEDWELSAEREAELAALGAPIMRTSAKTGQNVQEAFLALSRLLLSR